MAPNARDASRSVFGTALKASSAIENTIGITASERPMPPTIALSRYGTPVMSCTHDATETKQKKPITTDGKPASSSIPGLTISRIHGFAKKATKSAARIPSGAPIRIAIRVVFAVPINSGTMPNFGTSPTGCHVELKKFSVNDSVSPRTTSSSVEAASMSGGIKPVDGL